MEDAAQYAKMKVADLKKELKARGLAVTGNKNELVERLLSAEGHAPLESVEGDDEEFDEEEILGGEMDATEIKLTPQEEEAALTGANVKVKKAAAQKTPAKKNGKLNLKRTEPAPEVPAAKSPAKTPVAVDKEKEQENIEPPKKVVKVNESESDEGEKTAQEKRAERFGIPMTDEAKKQARAARFGELTNGTVKGSNKLSTVTGGINIDKLKARAERFGEITSKSLSKAEELEKKKTRMERFGAETAKAEADPAVDAAKAARAARFATDAKSEKPKEEEKEEAAEEEKEEAAEATPAKPATKAAATEVAQ